MRGVYFGGEAVFYYLVYHSKFCQVARDPLKCGNYYQRLGRYLKKAIFHIRSSHFNCIGGSSTGSQKCRLPKSLEVSNALEYKVHPLFEKALFLSNSQLEFR